MKILASLAHTEYGWGKKSLMTVFNAFFLSRMNYASAAWQCRLTVSQLSNLVCTQKRALRIVTGQIRSSPAEALLA